MINDMDKDTTHMFVDESFMKKAVEYYCNCVLFKEVVFVEEVAYCNYLGGESNDKPFKIKINHIMPEI